MSKYTTEVRFICEMLCDYDESKGYNDIETILTTSAPLIFNFSFPIFDSNYKLPLEKKILKHYYTREISEETVGLWKLRLNAKMNEIMPYYNQLYKSELLEFNPLYDVDMTIDKNRELAQTTSNISTGVNSGRNTGESENAYSDTPQGGLELVRDLEYLTNATIGNEKSSFDSSNANTFSGNATNLDTYIEHVIGKASRVSYSQKLQEFRETFLNIDMMVINDLRTLFFNLW